MRIARIPLTLALITLGALGCLLLHGNLPAQSKPVPVIGAVHSIGQKRFSEGQVIAASGLRAGQEFDVNAVQAATQKLWHSGAFEEVQFKYRPENGQMIVAFSVKEATRFHRCTYDNFVWNSTKEIEDFVRREVPLFDGFAPEGGDLADDVGGSLERFLQQRGITGHVERVRFGRSIGDTDWEHLYSVNGPVVKVQTVSFEGVKGIEVELLQKEAKPLVGRNYSLVECRRYAEASFIPVYRERGFLKVEVGSPAAQLSEQSLGGNEFAIQIGYQVKEGVAYDWEPAKWSGNQAESSADLDALLGLKQGQRANGKKIDAGWEAIHEAYGRKGFLEASVRPEAIYDDTNRRVEYRVAIAEGPQYKMGTFSVRGMPPANAERITSRWKLKSGDIYDASYMKEFLKTQLPPELPSFRERLPKIQTNIQPDRTAHTVDVSLQMQ